MKAGETLFSISQQYDVTTDEIKKLNPSAREGIQTGQRLVIPPSHTNTAVAQPADNNAPKNKAKNVKLDSLLTYCIEPNKRQNFQLNLKYEASKEWTFNTRVEFSKFSTDSKGDTSGFLMAQDITYRPERIPFSFAMRYALFDAPYDARIYAFERDLSYEFSVPAHNGKGSRFYFYINWKMAPNINLSARYSIWYYPDKEFIGSGADKINDNKKQEIKLQFRVNF